MGTSDSVSAAHLGQLHVKDLDLQPELLPLQEQVSSLQLQQVVIHWWKKICSGNTQE